jgi:hypothetical protein
MTPDEQLLAECKALDDAYARAAAFDAEQQALWEATLTAEELEEAKEWAEYTNEREHS